MPYDVESLDTRVYTRKTKAGEVQCLDLRSEEFGRLAERFARKTMYDPSKSGWPLGRGRGTTDPALAAVWLESYANWINGEISGMRAKECGFLVAKDAADQYLKVLAEKLGLRHNTVINRRSTVKCHIKPAVGEKLLTTLSPRKVRALLENITIQTLQDGKRVRRTASAETRNYVLTTLNAIWHHHYPGQDPPWNGVSVPASTSGSDRIEAARAGHILGGKDSYDCDEMAHLFEVAAACDQELLHGANSGRCSANIAPFIAFLLYTGARVAEAAMMRWHFVREDLGVLYLPGTKTSKAPRWIPLQEGLRPWIASLRAAGGSTDAMQWIFPSSPKSPVPTISTHQGHVRKALIRAGLKKDGVNTRALRNTHTTFATSSGYDRKKLQLWIGHSDGSLIDERYLDRDGLAALSTDEDRSYIPVFPVPGAP